MYSHKTGKDDWLEQVNGKRYMFQEAHNWKNSEVSEEVKLNGQERQLESFFFCHYIFLLYYKDRMIQEEEVGFKNLKQQS
jgi:hypothetical protein